MSPLTKTLAALAAVIALSSSADAQGVVTQKNVSLAMAQSIAQAALEKCQSMGFKVSVAVVDRAGLQVVHAARRRRRPAHAGRRRPQGLHGAHLSARRRPISPSA